MKLMIIVLCLLSERFLIHSISLHRFTWFDDYVTFVKNKIENNPYFNNPWIKLAAIILPILCLTLFVYLLFKGMFFGFAGLVLSALIFFYCLGPQNAFYLTNDNDGCGQDIEQIKNYFTVVNSQLFSVVFWYIIGGPVIVLIYKMFALSRAVDVVSEQASDVTDVLEWIPARITVLLFLTVGNFQRGYKMFTQYLFARPNVNGQMVSECGLQAVRVDESEEIPMPSAEAMVEQAAVVLLVLIALFTLVAWL